MDSEYFFNLKRNLYVGRIIGEIELETFIKLIRKGSTQVLNIDLMNRP